MDPDHHAEFDVPARIARMPMEVEVFSVDDRARLDDALAVRFAVFVDEQRVPADEEVDEHDRDDPDARHALVRETSGAGAIAAGRSYRKDARTVQIGRMAVAASHRGRGVGRLVLDALLADARARGFTRASLNAQVHAQSFYRNAGFTPVGPTFLECEIVHQAMDRDL
jgi:predicted GNAT family N-acyltransferase